MNIPPSSGTLSATLQKIIPSMNMLRSIRHKLVFVMMITNAVSVLIASGAFVANDYIMFRNGIIRDTSILAGMVADNCTAALAFEDARSATSILSSLKSQPQIEFSSIHTLNGDELARYMRDTSQPPPPLGQLPDSGHLLLDGALYIVKPVVYNGEHIGTLYIRHNLKELHSRIAVYSGSALLVSILTFIVAFIMSARLQRFISEPLLHLTTITAKVSQEKDYSLRADVIGQDEISQLTTGFNDMLGQIQLRDRELEQHRESLERLVEQRTEQLYDLNTELRVVNVELKTQVEETRLAKDEIRLNEERFRTLIESAPMMVMVITEGCLAYLNPAAAISFGFSDPQQFIGMPFFDRLDPEHRSSFQERVRLVETTGAHSEMVEGTFIRLDGSCFPVEITSITVLYAGTPSLLVLAVDISERKLMQDQLVKNQRMESIGVLAGGIAHNFNNVLTGVTGYISLAKKFLEPEHRALAMLVKAQQATTRAAGIATQLLTFARGGEPIKHPVSARMIVNESLSLGLAGSNVRPKLHISNELLPIMGDENQLNQAFNCIIINAVQAMRDGGSLTIDGKNVMLFHGNSLGLAPGAYIRLSFHDQGCGIPADAIGKIFTPYFTTKAEIGTGLGLASTHSIITRHGGTIGVESSVEHGTTFTIHLPAISDLPAITPHKPPGPPAPHIPGNSLLVMDDEEMICSVIKESLESSGYLVATCNSGDAAVSLYQEALEQSRPFDAVILDLVIPGEMGGLEVGRRIRALDPDATLIIASGYSNDPVMSDYREMGFAAAMVKPFTIEMLEHQLAAVSTKK